MLTFEKVLAAFEDYIAEDARVEILITSHGYAVMEWADISQDWDEAQICHIPEDMKDILLGTLDGYLEYKTTLCKRDLTDNERQPIRDQVEKMSDSIQ